ncbi:MAG: hypothetical protein IJT54_00125 [Candidatus Methanomethylophilaceae archaeon]|nr:hypothetical protein [Candidatus Methanomethylophilaceae archaeon]
MRALPEGVGKRMHIPDSRFEWRRLVLLAVVLSVVIAFSSFRLICSDSTEEYVAAAEGDPGWDPNWPVPYWCCCSPCSCTEEGSKQKGEK